MKIRCGFVSVLFVLAVLVRPAGASSIKLTGSNGNGNGNGNGSTTTPSGSSTSSSNSTSSGTSTSSGSTTGTTTTSSGNNGNGNGNGNSSGTGNAHSPTPPPAPPACVSPTCVDLTTRGSSGVANGAIFTQIDPQPTGTGYIDPFLRLQSTGVQLHTEGYNTSYRPFQATFDQKNPLNYTHDLLLSDVGYVLRSGILYREFRLDINESKAGDNPMLSLDQLQIFQSTSGGAHDYPNDLGTLIYDLDAGSDRWVLLNYALNHGSGSGDMSVLIPNSLFNRDPYVYLFSRFGDTWPVDAGFEEWTAGQGAPPKVPEPGTLLMLAPALAGLLKVRRRRR